MTACEDVSGCRRALWHWRNKAAVAAAEGLLMTPCTSANWAASNKRRDIWHQWRWIRSHTHKLPMLEDRLGYRGSCCGRRVVCFVVVGDTALRRWEMRRGDGRGVLRRQGFWFGCAEVEVVVLRARELAGLHAGKGLGKSSQVVVKIRRGRARVCGKRRCCSSLVCWIPRCTEYGCSRRAAAGGTNGTGPVGQAR